jgi:hypothetical protein
MEIVRCLGTRFLQQSFHLRTLVSVGKASLHEISFVHSIAIRGCQSPILLSVGYILTSAVSSEERGALANSVENQYTNDVRIDKENPDIFKCEVKICSQKQEILLEYSAARTWSKESDVIQNPALEVLIWFNNYFKQLNTKTDKLYLSKCTDGFKIRQNIFL